MILISGYIRTDPTIVRDLAERLRGGIPATRLEDGCLFYDFAIADETTGTILALERWRDEAALRTHLATPAIDALMREWGDRIEIEVTKHDLHNERGFSD